MFLHPLYFARNLETADIWVLKHKMCNKSRVIRLQILALKPNDIAYSHTFRSTPTPLTKFLIDHLLHVLRLSVRHITCEGNYILMHTCLQMYTCTYMQIALLFTWYTIHWFYCLLLRIKYDIVETVYVNFYFMEFKSGNCWTWVVVSFLIESEDYSVRNPFYNFMWTLVMYYNIKIDILFL